MNQNQFNTKEIATDYLVLLAQMIKHIGMTKQRHYWSF